MLRNDLTSRDLTTDTGSLTATITATCQAQCAGADRCRAA